VAHSHDSGAFHRWHAAPSRRASVSLPGAQLFNALYNPPSVPDDRLKWPVSSGKSRAARLVPVSSLLPCFFVDVARAYDVRTDEGEIRDEHFPEAGYLINQRSRSGAGGDALLARETAQPACRVAGRGATWPGRLMPYVT